MKILKHLLFLVLFAAQAWASEVIPVLEINGVRYESVRSGPVNGENVVLFHSRGVTTVPVASVPADAQARLGIKTASASLKASPPENDFLPIPREVTNRPPAPPVLAAPVVPVAPPPVPQQDPAAILEAMRAKRTESKPPSTTGGDWTTYNRERMTRVILDGQLVEKTSLTMLVGFLFRERLTVADGSKKYFGAGLELAERKPNTDNVAPAMEMRPSLWRSLNEQVFLLNYKPGTLPGALLKVYAVEVDPIDGWRTFKVGTEPSFEEWKRLR